MSRRRNRPNLPEETLRRARRAAGLPAPETDSEALPAMPSVSPESSTHSRAARRAARRRQRLDDASQIALNEGTPDAAAIAERLAAPTRQVSEGELRAAYAHVLRDLRSMGLLAALLLGALVSLALVL